jgi:hypothetical protein
VAGDPISTDLGVGRQLEAALDLLGMDLAYVAEVHGSHQVYRAAEGDELAFGLEVGEVVPSERKRLQRRRELVAESHPRHRSEAGGPLLRFRPGAARRRPLLRQPLLRQPAD